MYGTTAKINVNIEELSIRMLITQTILYRRMFMDQKNSPLFKDFLHGGDYNPDQWLDCPEIIQEDYRLMKLAGCNTFSLNIFGWSAIEPKEGEYDFGWLDTIMEDLASIGAYIILATPSGARPAWLSKKYPEVLRVDSNRQRILHGKRHNHCYTSKIYREKTQEINRIIAERYQDHPALIMWHISNEYGGECHCDLCQEAFRSWLKTRYNNDLNALNKAWWTAFWSHKYSEWSEIESPSPIGQDSIHGHNLDWKRFVTDQTIDFYKNEIIPLRGITPDIPVTTNFMGDYPYMGPFTGLNYDKFAQEVDVITWDSYPAWHNNFQETSDLAADVGFVHDIFRSLRGGQPFLIMENTPSLVNWHEVNKPKRPGMHLLSSLQSIAHGSDSILYFQWRKSRGSFEKFHGAVVDHSRSEETRVFKEVAELGEVLKQMKDVKGTSVDAEVAIVYDWENHWAIDDAQALKLNKKEYVSSCQTHYKSFWKKGIPVDVISMDRDLSKYKLVIAPMLYMLRPGAAEKIRAFVAVGGTFVTTYWSGIVDENDLCFLGGFPGPLKDVLGIWSEEIDSLYDSDKNAIQMKDDNSIGMSGNYQVEDYCDIIHTEGAETLATYKSEYYAGTPALTVNKLANGKAYYIASRNDQTFHDDFFVHLIDELKITPIIGGVVPEGVSVQKRSSESHDYIFVMNFTEQNQTITLQEQENYFEIITGSLVQTKVELKKYGVAVLQTEKE